MLIPFLCLASFASGPVSQHAPCAESPLALLSAENPIAVAGDEGKGQKDRAERREKAQERGKKDEDKSKDAKAAPRKIQSFSAKDMDGKKIDFPSDYKGKIVMLDFWATWCNPCMAELPHVVSAYDKFHEQGFDVVGVTLDNKGAEEKIKSVEAERGMKWPQIYSGKFWNAPLAKKFSIHSIPQAYLVDGDTGEILAEGMSMRGNALAGSIEAALARKAESKKSSKNGKDDPKDSKAAPAKPEGDGQKSAPEGEKKTPDTTEKPAGNGSQQR